MVDKTYDSSPKEKQNTQSLMTHMYIFKKLGKCTNKKGNRVLGASIPSVCCLPPPPPLSLHSKALSLLLVGQDPDEEERGGWRRYRSGPLIVVVALVLLVLWLSFLFSRAAKSLFRIFKSRDKVRS